MRVVVATIVCVMMGAAARAEELSGVVLTDEGKPAARATLSAAAIFHTPPLRLTTVADEQGTFKLDLPKQSGSKRYALAVRWQRQGADLTEGLDEAGKPTSLKGQKLPPLVVRLQPAGRLRGKLLRAEDDGPIAGAKLFLDTGEVLTTDHEGAFTLDGLKMDEHSLIPAATGRVRQYVLFDTSNEPEATLEIRLPQGAVIKGRIVDEAGKPIPGAYLTRASSGTALTLNGWDEVCRADGTFEYGGLSSQRLFYSLEAAAPGYGSHTIPSEVDDPAQVIERDVTLKRIIAKTAAEKPADTAEESKTVKNTRTIELPRHTISGVVTGAGKPIAGAKVRWGTFQWDSSVKSATTDAEGTFELVGAPAADGAVFVVADGYAPQFAPAKADQDRVDVSLLRGTKVRGVVKNSAGRGVADVQVLTVTRAMETGYCSPVWIDERSARTDAEGVFEIDAVPAGVTFDILKTGYSEHRNVTLEVGDKTNEIKLSAGGAVRGRVVDAAGHPVRNFKVRVMIPREREPGEAAGGYYAGFDWYGVMFTRDDGTFVMSGMGAGCWLRLIVSAPGIGYAVVDRAQAGALDAPPPADDLTIRLKPYQALAVRVIEAGSGKPLPGARVALLEDELHTGGFSWGYHDLWAVRQRADSEGTAPFTEPVCEDGTLIVRSPRMARRRVVWHGEPKVTVELWPAASLQGEVHLGGKRLAEGWARLMSADNDYLGDDLAEGEGRFNFDELPAGDYTLSITGAGGQQLDTRKVTLVAGATQAENFDLPADAGKKPPEK